MLQRIGGLALPLRVEPGGARLGDEQGLLAGRVEPDVVERVAAAVPAATSRRASAARASDPAAARAPGTPLLEMRDHVRAPRAALGGTRHPAPSGPASAKAGIDRPAANPGSRPGSTRRLRPGGTRRWRASAAASAREVSAAACGSGPEIASSNMREAGPSPISSRMRRSCGVRGEGMNSRRSVPITRCRSTIHPRIATVAIQATSSRPLRALVIGLLPVAADAPGVEHVPIERRGKIARPCHAERHQAPSPSGSSSVKHFGRFSSPSTTIRDRRRLSLSSRGVSVISQRASEPCAVTAKYRSSSLAIALEDRAEARQHSAQLRGPVESEAPRLAARALDGNVLALQFGHLLRTATPRVARASHPRDARGDRRPRSALRAGSSSGPRRSSSSPAPVVAVVRAAHRRQDQPRAAELTPASGRSLPAGRSFQKS